MVITSLQCPVLGAHVTRVTDFEGNVMRIIRTVGVVLAAQEAVRCGSSC
jgi:hypothetical protein